MQLVLGIALTVVYLGISQALIGRFPGGGIILGWFFAPAGMMMAAGFAAWLLCNVLPVPWVARSYGPPPRRAHLSWRAAVRGPVMTPWLLFFGNLLWVMRGASGFERALWLAAPALLAILAWVATLQRRKLRLLQDGEVATAFVYRRDDDDGPNSRVYFRFTTRDGVVVSGWGWDRGYRVPVGEDVPVFYDAGNPKRHIAACSSWFEVD